MPSRRAIRLRAIILVAVLLLVGCNGCARAPRYFDYLNTSASATLQGRLGEIEISALLQSEGRAIADADSTALGCSFTLTYLSPPALAGVTVRYTAATDELRVSLGTLHAHGKTYAALAAPALLLLTESAPQTTTRGEDGTLVFTTADGARRTLSADGHPLALSQTKYGQHIELTVDWAAADKDK